MKKLSKVILVAVLALSMAACSNDSGNSDTSDTAAGKYNAGVYTEIVKGHNGDVEVSVQFSADKIEDVAVMNHSETPGISDGAIADLPKAIIDSQSTEVDVVSGATVTSNAIIEAVNMAIEEASVK